MTNMVQAIFSDITSQRFIHVQVRFFSFSLILLLNWFQILVMASSEYDATFRYVPSLQLVPYLSSNSLPYQFLFETCFWSFNLISGLEKHPLFTPPTHCLKISLQSFLTFFSSLTAPTTITTPTPHGWHSYISSTAPRPRHMQPSSHGIFSNFFYLFVSRSQLFSSDFFISLISVPWLDLVAPPQRLHAGWG